jgi:hypothetical protein
MLKTTLLFLGPTLFEHKALSTRVSPGLFFFCLDCLQPIIALVV